MKKKQEDLQQKIDELTADLQRQRADFENYHKRVDADKANFGDLTKAATIMKLLPIVDDIERALSHEPKELADNKWVQGVTGLNKKIEKSLSELGVARIDSKPGTTFDPNLHEAVMMLEGEGDKEVIAEELRAGYKLGQNVIRPSMVKVTKNF